MSFTYIALYRKYRSATFDEVISQEHITTTLKNQVKTGKLAHAYLFTGSRGTGKTSCAKIMAKAVNCLSPKDGNPCGECEMCKTIAAGCSDIIEMDAASNNSVDDVRMLRDEVMYSPVQCKYKVYIIDEVHMMSPSAFNALLKTIEEPPAHVIFILATTETHKVPATIVSRCQQFRFRRIDQNASSERLCEIARRENAELTRPAADLISRLSDGGMRDAVSLLDQCISVSRNIDETVVRDTAGVAGTEHLFAIADCVKTGNVAYALSVLDELPPGRTPVSTYLINEGKRDRMLAFIDSEISKGGQVYSVCPLIDDGDDPFEVKSAAMIHELMSEKLPDRRIAMLHGKMSADEKATVMAEFAEGKWDVLVSTTVIEVGVNVPNASVMVIENPERFGLSQLHQLRGRVGRGSRASHCILITPKTSSKDLKRLKFLADNTDGFKIAQYDLENRGPGDFFGTRQSGRMALDLSGDGIDELLEKAKEDALWLHSNKNDSISSILGEELSVYLN